MNRVIDAVAAFKQKGSGNGIAGSGEPPDNGAMEARVAKLEATMEHMVRDLGDIKADIREIKGHARADFRILFGATIAVALGLAGLMAKGFHWI